MENRKTTTIRLSEYDLEAILQIRAFYGQTSDNQAIIFAIHATVRQLNKEMEENHKKE